jgi:hypothetical protein
MARRQPQLKLSRRSAFRDPRIRISVVCEGKLTEPSYLKALARYCRTLIHVEEAMGVPMSIANRAIALQLQNRGEATNTFAKDDEFWAVFDRDEHPQFDEAINKAENAGVSVAYSNPCFELWLVLHYKNWDRPVSRGDIQRELRKLMPGYDPRKSKIVDFEAIKHAVQQAEARGSVLESNRKKEGAPRGNPSTSLFKLTSRIRFRAGK